MNQSMQRTGPSPLSCAVTLGEAVREEHGRAGVCPYVKALAPLLPPGLIDQLAYQLNVPAPPPPAPPPPPPSPPPKPAPAPDMEKLLQMMRLMEQFRPKPPCGS